LNSAGKLWEQIRQGDRRALARAATWIENGTQPGRELMKTAFPLAGQKPLIGLTGPPGAGKSTLAAALARVLRSQNKTVGILAVDPSSAWTRGAILGDRIRMQEHHGDPGVFIRSLATRGQLGGLAAATFDMAVLLHAAGFDAVLVETVGVGQGEIDVANIADATVVVLAPGLGDDIQAIKAGILEIADVFAVNKADLPGAERLRQDLRTMQSLGGSGDGERRNAPVCPVVATEGKGVTELLQAALEASQNKEGKPKLNVWQRRLQPYLAERVAHLVPESLLTQMSLELAEGRTDPYTAVEALLKPLLTASHSPVQINHLGIAVHSLDEALRFYQDQLGLPVQGRETVSTEQVHVALLPVGTPRIELLQAASSDSAIAKFIEKRGPGLHHIALTVDDLEKTVNRLKSNGAKILNEPRQGAGGHLYVFVHPQSTGGVLLELIQR
jgi:LAO/AO transport system kinase